MTEDLDVFVDVSPANVRRLRQALVDFGFGEAAPSLSELAERGKIWMLGRKPWRIDILTLIDGVTFQEAWRGHVEVPFGSSTLPVIGLAELLRNKRAAGRPKDLADVASLEAIGAAGLGSGTRRKRPRSVATRSKPPARRPRRRP